MDNQSSSPSTSENSAWSQSLNHDCVFEYATHVPEVPADIVAFLATFTDENNSSAIVSTENNFHSCDRWIGGTDMRMLNITGVASTSYGTSAPRESYQSRQVDPSPAASPQAQTTIRPQHSFVQVGTFTKASHLKDQIVRVKATDTGKAFFYVCAHPGCSREDRYSSEKKAISHIRRVHVQEKPFKCTTCGRCYAYIQDAKRHVNAKNNGKVHECAICHKRYEREDYRDMHQRRHIPH